MPEIFPDPMAKWTTAPIWSAARLARGNWEAAPEIGLSQILVSGKLEAAWKLLEAPSRTVGLWEIAPQPRAAIRIARDRALLVSSERLRIATGWRRDGWAASDASDAYFVIRLNGGALRDIVAEASSADVETISPSAAIHFAGVPALLYRVAEDAARLHVEASWAPYVWRWLETR